MANLKPYAFSFLGGVIYSLAWPTSLGKGILICAIPGMAMLLHQLLKEKRFWAKLRHMLSFCLPYSLIGFYWIPDTLAEFGQLPYVVALLLGAMFTFIAAPQLYVAILGIHFFQKLKQADAWTSKYPGLFSALAAAALSFVEYFTPQQFPVLIGQPWARIGEYLGYANIGGLPIYSFFSFLLALELVNWKRFKMFSKLNVTITLLFIVTNPLVKNANPEKDTKPIKMRLVQANISNFLKVDSESGAYASVSQVLQRYRELSEQPFELGEMDLLVWPETAYPFGIESDEEDLTQTPIPAIFKDIALRHEADMFIGGYDVIDANGDFFQSEYNSNFHIGPQSHLQNVYHKHILIPFGETLPFGPLNRYLSQHIQNISFFSEGTTFPLFKIRSGHTFINTICYEILKPEFVREYLNQQEERPHAMVNLTNDSWYGDTSEPEQHLFLASWRALEFDLPIIRSTNTGISTYLDRDGKELKRLGIGETGNLDLSIQLGRREATIFQRFGFWALLPLWFALFIFHGLLIKFKK